MPPDPWPARGADGGRPPVSTAPPDASGAGAGVPPARPRAIRDIDLLDDPSRILEALAQDLPAEAKQVLPHLITAAEACPDLDDDGRSTLLYHLRDAEGLLYHRRGESYPRGAAVAFTRANRFLWSRLPWSRILQ
jgi:hypothetical protein